MGIFREMKVSGDNYEDNHSLGIIMGIFRQMNEK